MGRSWYGVNLRTKGSSLNVVPSMDSRPLLVVRGRLLRFVLVQKRNTVMSRSFLNTGQCNSHEVSGNQVNSDNTNVVNCASKLNANEDAGGDAFAAVIV